MQADGDGVEIVVEQVGVGIKRDLGGLVPEHPLQRKHIHPGRHGQRRAHVARSCGVIL